jgi:hypothetical protein
MLGGPKVTRHDVERNHQGKLVVARLLTDFVVPLMRDSKLALPASAALLTKEIEKTARKADKDKQRALYADVNPDCRLVSIRKLCEWNARGRLDRVRNGEAAAVAIGVSRAGVAVPRRAGRWGLRSRAGSVPGLGR